MTEQSVCRVKKIARCKEQGEELARQFRRIIMEAVAQNAYRLSDEHWQNAVCYGIVRTLEQTPVPSGYGYAGVAAEAGEFDQMAKRLLLRALHDSADFGAGELCLEALGLCNENQMLFQFT